MAKLIGPIGSKMRGKVGQIVAAKTVGGDTAIRSYQPQVKNPNTLRQRVSRNKLKLASEIAAILSEAVGIGYAKAVQGMKMYPRNLFVSDIIRVDAGYITNNGDVAVLETEELPVSKKSGISVVPVITSAQNVYTAVNIGDVVVAEGETVAFVLVAYSLPRSVCFVKKVVKASSGDTTITLSPEEAEMLSEGTVMGFYKIVPEALNGVPTQDIPWKYPSATSVAVASL